MLTSTNECITTPHNSNEGEHIEIQEEEKTYENYNGDNEDITSNCVENENNNDVSGDNAGNNDEVVFTEALPNKETLINEENTTNGDVITNSRLHLGGLSNEVDMVDNDDKIGDNNDTMENNDEAIGVINDSEHEDNKTENNTKDNGDTIENGDIGIRYNGDNESIPYTLQLYLNKEDFINEDEMQYDDYIIITSGDVIVAENVTVKNEDTNEEFTEIELPGIDQNKTTEETISKVLIDTTTISPQDDHFAKDTSNDINANDINENDTSLTSSSLNENSHIVSVNLKTPDTLSVNDGTSVIHDQSEDETTNDHLTEQTLNKTKKEKIMFPVNKSIHITLKYTIGTKDILGNIRSVKGLGYEENKSYPQYIRFHITIIPQHKYRLKTKWIHASVRSLAWKFNIGPFTEEEIDPKGKNIRFRLYGRSNILLQRCYGECFIPLDEVIEAEKSTDFERNILPKGFLKNMNIKCRKSTSSLQPARNCNQPARRTKSMLL